MLSVTESAEMLGVSPQRVRAMIAAGVLPAVKFGKSWALREEDVVSRLAAKPRGGRPREGGPAESGELGSRDHQRSEELSGLYRACKRAFRHRPTAADIQAARSGEEAAFYMAVADFFLKQKQAELVKSGVC